MNEPARSRPSPSHVIDQSLPGIGHRYDVPSEDGSHVVVVIHHSGRRDLHLVGAGADEPDAVVTLTDAQARTLGAILGGAYFRPSVVDEIEALVGGLLIEWVTLEPTARGVGNTIGQLEIRRATGMTVVAIVRHHEPLVAPEPTERLRPGDQLVVMGRPEDLGRFRRLVVDPSG